VKLNNIQALLRQADSLQQELQENRDWQQQSVQEAFSIEYTYDSNRIEGNTLTLRETELVIHKGLTVAGKPMVEHLEAINHYEAIALLRDVVKEKTVLDQSLLLSLHSLILRGIDRDNAGRFRSVPVMISGSRHVPPQSWQLDKLMEDYFNDYAKRKSQLHPIVLAANMHERLVSIHPFIDGNGRTARLIMNLILLQHGFPIAIIHGDMASRLAYYNALEKCNLQDDTSDFHALIALAVVATMKRLLALVKRDE